MISRVPRDIKNMEMCFLNIMTIVETNIMQKLKLILRVCCLVQTLRALPGYYFY